MTSEGYGNEVFGIVIDSMTETEMGLPVDLVGFIANNHGEFSYCIVWTLYVCIGMSWKVFLKLLSIEKLIEFGRKSSRKIIA